MRTLYAILAILILGCSTDPSEREPIIDIVDHPDSEYYYHCKVVAREPLPYPVTIRMNTLYKGFGAAPDDLQCCSTFITGDRDYITVAPDTNEYLASFPRVLVGRRTATSHYVKVVTSVEVQIGAITDIEIYDRFPESEKERTYTVGQSRLTLGSRLTTTHLPEGWEWAK